ncbi:MAG: nickel-dependent lactate racemase [Negativicutes bacterium]|nr:nickel-dependent lactate racemase [Negativicutes bacterium]
MDIIKELLKPVPLPRMVKVRQTFPAPIVTDIPGTISQELAKPAIASRIRPGMRIAIAVGSRGIAEIPAIVKAVVSELNAKGAAPFIVPAMGSHGGATAEGQKQVLADLGVTEETAGCPILSSMEVVEIGRLDNGLPVYIDKNAYDADGIVIVCRVKPHTAFRGANESGLVKMITIGLGKQKGAESCHAYSFKHMAEHIVAMARISLAKAPILFGVASVENAYDQPAKLVAVPAETLIETDRELLLAAKANMPRLPFNQLDVLIVDQIGKDISGDGMDPNITGRYPTPYAFGGPEIAKIVVLDLTERTHGNANGMGAADFSTRKLADKVDFKKVYANGLTSAEVSPTKLPMILDDDRDAIKAAIKTCYARDQKQARVVRIKDTLHLGEFYISESLVAEAASLPNVTILGEPEDMAFDDKGNLI